MPDQPTPKPLTAEEEARWREGYKFLANAKTDCTCAICLSTKIVATLDASRAECAALRESLNECHRQHESVIERLDDSKAQVEVLRVHLDAAEKQRDAFGLELERLKEEARKDTDVHGY